MKTAGFDRWHRMMVGLILALAAGAFIFAGSGVAHADTSLSAAPSEAAFGALPSGYERPAPITVTVTVAGDINQGDTGLVNMSATLTGVSTDAFIVNSADLADITMLGVGESSSITVQPAAGLAPKHYIAAILLSGYDISKSATRTVSVPVSFTVTGVTATPTAHPAGGQYPDAVSVVLSCDTPGAVIYYTTDGNDPVDTSNRYAGQISIAADTTLKAIAISGNTSASNIMEERYVIDAPKQKTTTPTANPPGGQYEDPVSVTLSCETPDAAIYYTTDGSNPTSSGDVYAEPIAISADTTLKAIAIADDMLVSDTMTAAYTFDAPVEQTATPTANPAGGQYEDPVSVTLSCETPDAAIYYTTDGSNPTSSGDVYAEPIAISADTTLKAIAIADDMLASDIMEERYVIDVPKQKTAIPTANPTGGRYAEPVSVILSCETPDAIIYYTTDGSDPANSTSAYNEPIQIAADTALKAIATASGMSTSDQMSETYTFDVPLQRTATPTAYPTGGLYEDPVSVTLSCETPGAVIRYTTDGSDPLASSPAYTEPLRVVLDTTLKAMATVDGMLASDIMTENYSISLPAGFVPVTSIYNKATQIAHNATITLSGDVSPKDATNKTIVWSIQDILFGDLPLGHKDNRDEVRAGTKITGSQLTAAAYWASNETQTEYYRSPRYTIIITATIIDGIRPGVNYKQDFRLESWPVDTSTCNVGAGTPETLAFIALAFLVTGLVRIPRTRRGKNG